MPQAVVVSAPARLHIGLLDVGHATSRTFGGIGLMITDPSTQVRVEPADATWVSGADVRPETRELIRQRLGDLMADIGLPPVRVEIISCPPEHVGFGSKTSLVLSSLIAAARLFGVTVPDDAIQSYSRRGGASGTGIHGFFSGGLIADAGRLGRHPLRPSAQQRPASIPTVVRRVDIPPSWEVSLFLPAGRRMFGSAEAAFFDQVTPIPRMEVLEQIALTYQDILPAVIDADIDSFGRAIDRFSQLGLKAREIAAQPSALRDLIARLRDHVPCVGMSSMGPVVYAISDGPLDDSALAEVGVKLFNRAKGSNEGYTVS
ncbi:hypothetical protein Ais01nite_58270 [Asanoa ishikariensis]|uniref:Beta-ribofuranosylaminobenzene 5'-phosphate synthase n=1 Tax=Asanoa ishikariensis TaxID=137265 RepID=A0A1H3UZZ5_9ACTN|nr:beta-ribofuranosylaminobenzene 5'-phosphate synthase family protein [Asanoa ishikariensis]GIF67792.1 hypothetical protein Ais01nite_58270 [Asanoa ishikariensis]SDZ67984.1 beta-ribofuranosylaminobenzene 5'-phosphate synthase [Asanoa ishikariensis]